LGGKCQKKPAEATKLSIHRAFPAILRWKGRGFGASCAVSAGRNVLFVTA
jgi:hypothetical protein